MEWLRI